MRRLIRRGFLPIASPRRLGRVAGVLDGFAGLMRRRLARLAGACPACAARRTAARSTFDIRGVAEAMARAVRNIRPRRRRGDRDFRR
jgi:hypothetical protein